MAYYGARTARTPAVAVSQLMRAIAIRLVNAPPPSECWTVRFPVGLLFARGDRKGDGQKLTEQIVASFEYWDKDSNDFLDLVLAGWGDAEQAEASPAFNIGDFLDFRKVIESSSKWTYSGETDLLLLNFEMVFREVYGYFDYSEVIVLPLEKMVREKQIGSVDGFISELVGVAKSLDYSSRYGGSSPVWEISDKTGILRAKRDIWQFAKELVLGKHAAKLDGFENLAIRDLQRDGSPFLHLPLDEERSIQKLLSSLPIAQF